MTGAVPHIARMAAYGLADLTVPPGKTLLSLSQNESLRGPAPGVQAAVGRAVAEGALYPDPDWAELRAALAAVHGVAAERILCGAGSLELIGCLARAFCGPGRAVLAPAHAYPFFRTAAAQANARFDVAAETECRVDVAALLAAVRPDTAVVFVANPGNPTGTRLSGAQMRALRAGLPERVLLVIDEAYGEFADGAGPGLFDLVDVGNTVVLRTFSKAYGMAGFRVGWGLFPPNVAREVRKVLNPNNISALSQAAAVAALEDQGYMRETCAMTAELRDGLAVCLAGLGLPCLPSHTNFLLLDLGTAARARAFDLGLRAEGIFLRSQGGAGLAHMVRVTVGPAAAHDRLLAALAKLDWEEN